MDSRERTEDHELADLTRPIIGIENRTALEVFDIMCARIKHRRPSPVAESTPTAPEIATGTGLSVLGQSGPIDTAPVQIGTRCSQCGTAAPQAFAHECTRPVCAYRAALSTPTDATAVEAEREACAKVADAWTATDPVSGRHAHMLAAGMREAAREIAATIRARTPKES